MRGRGIVAGLALLALAGCKVIVLGDSNSCMEIKPHACMPGFWPDMLQKRLDDRRAMWVVENWGQPGLVAGRSVDAAGKDVISQFTGDPLNGMFHLERLLREDDLARTCRFVPLSALAPRLVIALGTNDIGRGPGWQVVDHIMALGTRALEVAPCLKIYYATIPPRFDPTFNNEPNRLMANALLRARVPPDRLIDFDTGFVKEDLAPSGIHFSPDAQRRRMERVFPVLFPGLAS